MTSELDISVSSLIERLVAMPLFSPFTTSPPESDPNHRSENPHHSTNASSTDRVILINPLTQGMVVIGGGFDSLLYHLMRNDGQPPASQASIDGMPSLEIKCREDIESVGGECVICLEEWGIGDVVKEMPCKHKFHGGCVEKWLKIHGSCPVCRYKMPPVDDDDDDLDKKIGNESGRGRREIWVTFSFSNGRSTSESEGSNQESSA